MRVHCRETLDAEWTEVTRCLDLTPFGASFSLSRPTERGRLLHLTMPMPRQLRVFDHIEDQYRVWSLVRSTTWLPTTDGTGGGDRRGFVVGVAFVGKRPPASYQQNPSLRYEARGAGESLEALQLRVVEPPRQSPTTERETRLHAPIEMSIEVPGEQGEAGAREETVTENISRRGATVYTTLPVTVGRFVRLTGARGGTTIFAAVRGRTEGAGGVARLHLEFVGGEWPLEDFT